MAKVKRKKKQTSKKKMTMAAKIRAKAKEQLAKRTKEDAKRSRGFGGSTYLIRDISYKKFDPKPGDDYLIDVIPFVMGDNCPINLDTGRVAVPEGEIGYNVDFWIHRNIGVAKNQAIVCPEKTYNKPCPICDHKRELLSAGKDIDDKSWQEMSPKRRTLYNVICYDPDQTDVGVQVWDVPYFYMQKHLMKLVKGPIRGKKKGVRPFISFSDPSRKGKSIAFSIEKAKSKEAFNEYMAHRFENRDYDLDDDILEAVVPLDQLLQLKSFKEIYEIYFDEEYEEDNKKRGRKGRSKRDEENDSDDDWEDDIEEDEDEDEDIEDEEEDEDEDEDIEDEDDEEEYEDEDDEEEEYEDEDECPEGYEYGFDYDLWDECEDCDVRAECKKEKIRIKKKKAKGKKKKIKRKRK